MPDRPTRLVPEISRDVDPVRGHIGPAAPAPEPFTGWSELAAAIERYRTGPPATTASPFGAPTHKDNVAMSQGGIMRKTLVVLVAMLAACVVAVVTGPVQAAFATYPGSNGRLAFGMRDATGAHVYSVSPDGHGLHQLTTGPYFDLCPAYSATGKDIAFCSNRSGSFEIWSMAGERSPSAATHDHRVCLVSGLLTPRRPDRVRRPGDRRPER